MVWKSVSVKEVATDQVEIYLEERKLLVEAQRASYQQFDRYVLTLSTGFLSLSVVFLKDIFPQAILSDKGLLVTSWILFCASIVTTLISFLASQFAYTRQLQITEDYYVRKDEKALQAKNNWARATSVMNIFSAAFFVLAVITTVLFVSLNFTK
jgi:hypothetical protein